MLATPRAVAGALADVALAVSAIALVAALTPRALGAPALAPLVRAADAWVRRAFPGVTGDALGDRPSDAIFWFLPPAHHAVEWALFHAATLPLLAFFARGPWARAVPALAARVSSADVWTNRVDEAREAAVFAAGRAKAGGWLRALDGALSAVAWATGASTIYYKLDKGKPAYLLNPCHLVNFAVMALTLLGGEAGAPLFNFVLCAMYGLIIALVAPDTRGLSRTNGEFEMFFVYHVALLVLPLVWVARRRFTLYAGPRAVLATWAFLFLLHLDVFLPVSMLTGAG